MKNNKQKIALAFTKNQKQSILFIKRNFNFSNAEAEDIYQDAWVWILMNAKTPPDLTIAQNWPWLKRVLYTICLSKIRNTKLYIKKLMEWHQHIKEETRNDCESKDLKKFYKFLSNHNINLTNHGKRLLDLKYVEGLCIEAIARELGFTNTCEQNYRHCRNQWEW